MISSLSFRILMCLPLWERHLKHPKSLSLALFLHLSVQNITTLYLLFLFLLCDFLDSDGCTPSLIQKRSPSIPFWMNLVCFHTSEFWDSKILCFSYTFIVHFPVLLMPLLFSLPLFKIIVIKFCVFYLSCFCVHYISCSCSKNKTTWQSVFLTISSTSLLHCIRFIKQISFKININSRTGSEFHRIREINLKLSRLSKSTFNSSQLTLFGSNGHANELERWKKAMNNTGVTSPPFSTRSLPIYV